MRKFKYLTPETKIILINRSDIIGTSEEKKYKNSDDPYNNDEENTSSTE